jgi:hydrogenase nickel incorporation protein HypB
MVINKIDLMGFSEFDLTQVRQNALCINGNLNIFETSCRTGAGLDSWYDWLRRLIAAKHA